MTHYDAQNFHLRGYEIRKDGKIGELAENSSIKEFILANMAEKFAYLLDLYNKSEVLFEKISACRTILIFSSDSTFTKIIRGNKRFCANFSADLDRGNIKLNEYLVEINYNLCIDKCNVGCNRNRSFNRVQNLRCKIECLESALKQIEAKLPTQDGSFLQMFDQIIKENGKSAVIFGDLETVLFCFALVKIKQYFNEFISQCNNWSIIDLQVKYIEYYNDNESVCLAKIFSKPSDLNIILDYFESASFSGEDCLIDKLTSVLFDIINSY